MKISENPGVPGHTKYLGDRLLKYILNIDDEDSERALMAGGPFSVQQQATLSEMAGILIRIKRARTQNKVLQWLDEETDDNGKGTFIAYRFEIRGLEPCSSSRRAVLYPADPPLRKQQDERNRGP